MINLSPFYSFIGVNQSLPTTAYIKMIDIWMICSMLYPFFVVFLYSILEVLKNKSNSVKTASDDLVDSDQKYIIKKSGGGWIDLSKKNLSAVRIVSCILDWGLPLVVTIFIIIYWTFGVVNYYFSDIEHVC